MIKLPFILILTGITALATGQDSLTRVPVHDTPVWQQIQSVPESQGQTPHPSYVEVKSLTTHQVLGWVPLGHRFLSFGSGQGIVTLPLNGEIGYVPRAVVARMYAPTPTRELPPPGPITVEELAAEYETRVVTGAGVSLRASDSVVETVRRESELLTATGLQPGTTGEFGQGGIIDATMPGATLATGGPQAIGTALGTATGPMY